MSDETISPAQIRAARALLGWSQGDLAERAGTSEAGVGEIEAGGGDPASHAKVVTTLEAGGVRFVAEDEGQGAGVRMARPHAPPIAIPVAELNASNDE